jgi:hypothetical protein
MYGKTFASMYRGSMYGAGINVFAVWGYIVANAYKSHIEINPTEIANVLGGEITDVEEALDFLQRPDPKSRYKEHEGRRLVKEGEYQYFVPSWEKYNRIRTEEDRREYNRVAQQRWRANHQDKKPGRKKNRGPTATETAFVKADGDGNHADADKLLEPVSPTLSQDLNLAIDQ